VIKTTLPFNVGVDEIYKIVIVYKMIDAKMIAFTYEIAE
jgi:hypothetical protein